jgi:hypothetical protein
VSDFGPTPAAMDAKVSPMCEQCRDLDKKIQRYSEFLRQGLDPLTSERIKEAIKEMQRQVLACFNP